MEIYVKPKNFRYTSQNHKPYSLTEQERKTVIEKIEKMNFATGEHIRRVRRSIDYNLTEPPLCYILDYTGGITYRNEFIWDEYQQSKFIELVILGFFMNRVYVVRKDIEIYVLDGTQRVTSLFNYYNNKLVLKGLTLLPLLNGTKYENLDIPSKKRFLRETIALTELEDEVPVYIQNDLYKLVNNER